MRRLIALVLSLAFLALPAQADPELYRLDKPNSVVAFDYSFSGEPRTGRMAVDNAQITVDLDNVSASRVNVALDVSRADAGFAFATQAMRGPEVLDAARYPQILFRSTEIRGSLQNAAVAGLLTIRDVTRPVTLRAKLGRVPGTAPTARDQLIVYLEGSVSRAAFGATGFAGYVGDTISIRIAARIVK
jgi:polyisoprenoid-binding protein YceI